MTKKTTKKRMSGMLIALLFAASSSLSMASDITGVSGTNGVFNIAPTKNINDIGFREYQNFQLTKGDTANLRFSGISKFVNMVDNQININGLVRTVDNANKFTPGHAIFMSPNGMVVGADGVLNVGSLSVYTPTVSGMKMLKNGVASGNLVVQDGKYKGVDLMEAMGWHGNAPITINGKVVAANDITMVANSFTMGANAGILAGADLSSNTLFNELVNTKTNNNSKVEIRTYDRNGTNTGLTLNGTLKNTGKGNIEITNRGANGLKSNGTIENNNGQLHLVNAKGSMNVAGNIIGNGDRVYLTNGADAGKATISGNVTANAGAKIWNKSASGLQFANTANITSAGNGLAITSESGGANLGGNIKLTNSDLNITNKNASLKLNNVTATNSSLVISNEGSGGMQLDGTISNNKSTAITNYNGAMTLNGTVKNTAGKMNLTNKGNGGFYSSEASKINSTGEEVLIQNVGTGGFTSNSSIYSTGKTYLQNTKGNMLIDGDINGNGNLLYIGNTGNGKLDVHGDLVSNDKLQVYNNGSGGMELNGVIETSKSAAITNKSGTMEVNGVINHTGGKLNMTNKGAGGLLLGEKLELTSNGNELLIQNAGAGGFTSKANIESSSKTYLQNTKGDMKILGNLNNSNNLLYVGNVGDGSLTVNGNLNNQKAAIQVYNKGAKGMTVNGDITNKNGGIAITNRSGNYVMNGDATDTQKGNINLTNVGNGGLTLAQSAKVSSESGEVILQNTGAKGLAINGVVDNKGNVVVYNKAGNLNIASTGKIKATDANVYVSNAGNAMSTQKGSEVIAKGEGTKLNMLNTGNGGMTLNGTTRHSTGRTLVTNKAGNLTLNGLVENSGGRVYLNNSGHGALNITENGGISNTGLGRTYLTNKGDGGMQVDGTVAGGGHIIATNRSGGMNITSKVTSTASNVVLSNTGNEDMNITGTVRGNKVTAKTIGNDIVLGNKNTNQIAINGLKKVFITTKDGSIKNVGVDTHLIKSGGNLYMAADNGTIGKDVNTSGVGANSRDLTKSVNVVVNGRVKAFTTDKKNNSVINIATKGNDLKVDRIKADGKVILLTDKYTDTNGKEHTGSILNASTQLKNYANVKGTTVQMLSSGSIGTKEKPLHFRQTDATQKSNVVAVKNVDLHARGRANGEDVNFGVIKSKESYINADLIKNATIDNAVAPGKINITTRRSGAQLNVKKTSHNPKIIKDYFDSEM